MFPFDTFFQKSPVYPPATSMTTSTGPGAEYELSCTDCSFTTVIAGDIDEIFDAIDDHQAEVRDHHADHFVNFEALANQTAD